MNKHSATKKRPTKARRTSSARKPSARNARPRQSRARKPEPQAVRKPAMLMAREPEPAPAEPVAGIGPVTISRFPPLGAGLRSHKFQVGQTVFYTSSPISRPGATGSYKVVRLLPSDGEDYQYRIKNPGEAFERVAKESQLELEG